MTRVFLRVPVVAVWLLLRLSSSAYAARLVSLANSTVPGCGLIAPGELKSDGSFVNVAPFNGVPGESGLWGVIIFTFNIIAIAMLLDAAIALMRQYRFVSG